MWNRQLKVKHFFLDLIPFTILQKIAIRARWDHLDRTRCISKRPSADLAESDSSANNFVCILIDETKPASLQRVEELTGKSVAFHNADIGDPQSLEKIFNQVNQIILLFLY